MNCSQKTKIIGEHILHFISDYIFLNIIKSLALAAIKDRGLYRIVNMWGLGEDKSQTISVSDTY